MAGSNSSRDSDSSEDESSSRLDRAKLELAKICGPFTLQHLTAQTPIPKKLRTYVQSGPPSNTPFFLWTNFQQTVRNADPRSLNHDYVHNGDDYFRWSSSEEEEGGDADENEALPPYMSCANSHNFLHDLLENLTDE